MDSDGGILLFLYFGGVVAEGLNNMNDDNAILNLPPCFVPQRHGLDSDGFEHITSLTCCSKMDQLGCGFLYFVCHILRKSETGGRSLHFANFPLNFIS